jgi:hypothetical protein
MGRWYRGSVYAVCNAQDEYLPYDILLVPASAFRTDAAYRQPFTGHMDRMKMGLIPVAAKVVVRTGYGEAVRVFDLGTTERTDK